MTKVFINGSSGTTGLRLFQRLGLRDDVELLTIEDSQRKDPEQVKKRISESHVTFFCLPDQAAREAAALAEGTGAKIIDTSTAHRTSPAWVYGFPELSANQREGIAGADRVTVPGCHATGFIAPVYPLVAAGIIPADYPFSCLSLTGYSGGGKGMIAEYEAQDRSPLYSIPRQYALSQLHKHLPEMTQVTGIRHAPVFTPVVEDFYSGMLVTIPLHTRLLKGRPGLKEIWACLDGHYRDSELIRVMKPGFEGFLDAGALAGLDSMEIYVTGNDERVSLCARFDNLGKGASGAAIACFNLMIGAPITKGLRF